MITRRTTLAALGATLATPAILTGARAAAPMLGASRPTHLRFPLGDFEVTTIFDGSVQLPGPHPIFGQNVEASAVQDLAAANGLPREQMEIGFTPTLVNTGSDLILFDTGNDNRNRATAGKLRERMGLAGYAPEDVDIVVLTHFHGDHIGGMLDENDAPAFPNARYVTNEIEYDHWIGSENESALKYVKPFAERMTFIKDGNDVVSGVTAIGAYGHTPGHTIYNIESGGKRVVITSDTANHFVVSLERPDWHVRFDMDKDAAVASRKRVFDMIATDGVPFIGYHMPNSAVGYVMPNGSGGFTYEAAAYQLFL